MSSKGGLQGAAGAKGSGTKSSGGSDPKGAAQAKRVLSQTQGQAESSSKMSSSSSSSSLPGNSSSSNLKVKAAESGGPRGTSKSSVREMYPGIGLSAVTPVYQVNHGNRNRGRVPIKPEDAPVTYDAEYHNPDGSLRTMHCLPEFEESITQANKTRYCRHYNKPEREQELTIQQIFEK